MSSPTVNASTPVQPPPPGVTSNFAHPEDFHLRNLFIATTVICVLLSTLSVFTRLYTRIFPIRMLGWDDAFAVVAMGLNFGLTVSFIGLMGCGLTFIAWNVRLDDFLSNYFNHWIYWNTIFTLILYFMYPLIKFSILAFYLRILGPTNKRYRIGVWVLIAFNMAILVSTVAALLQMCNPPAGLFYPWIQATCNISDVIFVVQAALQVLTDFLCLLPPIPFVLSLNLSRSRKAGVLLPILIGLFVTGIGIARMVLLIQGLSSANYAIDLEVWLGTYLAIIEINFALIAVCLPALNHLFKSARLAVDSIRSRQSKADRATFSSASVMSNPRKSFKNNRSYPSQLGDGSFEPEGDIELLYDRKDAFRSKERRLDNSESMHTTEQPEVRQYEPLS